MITYFTNFPEKIWQYCSIFSTNHNKLYAKAKKTPVLLLKAIDLLQFVCYYIIRDYEQTKPLARGMIVSSLQRLSVAKHLTAFFVYVYHYTIFPYEMQGFFCVFLLIFYIPQGFNSYSTFKHSDFSRYTEIFLIFKHFQLFNIQQKILKSVYDRNINGKKKCIANAWQNLWFVIQ